MSDKVKPMLNIPFLGRLTLLQGLAVLALLGVGLTVGLSYFFG